jgi:NadR type nicotinamide-nucleotide adenylyltransferase
MLSMAKKPSYKIAITGPESSGKSTLAIKLSNHYSAKLVEEYAREYLENLDRPYNQEDLDHIARKQFENEMIASKTGSPLIICDTDSLILEVWSRESFGGVSPVIQAISLNSSYDFTLLCSPDLPWQPDPLREHPSEVERMRLFQIYKQKLKHYGRTFGVVTGIGESRTECAISHVNAFLKAFKGA